MKRKVDSSRRVVLSNCPPRSRVRIEELSDGVWLVRRMGKRKVKYLAIRL